MMKKTKKSKVDRFNTYFAVVRFAIAMVISCMIMEEVMYGVMLSAKTDMLVKDPPVMALKNPNASPLCFAKKSAK